MIFIYKELIKKYINLFTPQDIITYAKSKNINLSKKESEIIYTFIKRHYLEILDNKTNCFKELKEKIRPELYTQILSVYNEAKLKYL